MREEADGGSFFGFGDGSFAYNNTYIYDTVGNVLTSSDGKTTHTYTYRNTDWRDLLTAYDGEAKGVVTMPVMKIVSIFPLIGDIIDEYQTDRENGAAREGAVTRLEEKYACELADSDEGPVVRIAFALALCKKRELTKAVLEDALRAAEQLKLAEPGDPVLPALDQAVRYISDPGRLGDSASYKKRLSYTPDWKVGDTFSHKLSGYMSKYAHIFGWYVLIRKVGEYKDHQNHVNQLAYVTICPPEKLPETAEALRSLGFLRMMPGEGNRWDYLAQIYFKNRKDEEAFNLSYIGNFPEAGMPDDASVEDPRVAMPLFGKLKREDILPSYDNDVCSIFKRNGVSK